MVAALPFLLAVFFPLLRGLVESRRGGFYVEERPCAFLAKVLFGSGGKRFFFLSDVDLDCCSRHRVKASRNEVKLEVSSKDHSVCAIKSQGQSLSILGTIFLHYFPLPGIALFTPQVPPLVTGSLSSLRPAFGMVGWGGACPLSLIIGPPKTTLLHPPLRYPWTVSPTISTL